MSMKYDFTIVRERFRRTGWTLEELTKKVTPKRHLGSIGRVMKSGKASKETAKAIIRPFGITYEMILPKEEKGRRSA